MSGKKLSSNAKLVYSEKLHQKFVQLSGNK